MATDTTGDIIQDEDLRKMWQETDDFDKKKEIRSHMYKIREARLKDFHNTGEESTSVSENRSRVSTTTTTRTDGGTVLKGSDLTTHADNLADHSFLSLKSKEIRDSESPTKDSYKIIETRKINDRDWNVVESNETSKDGKSHTTSRIATTSGRQDLDGGESKYAAKSEQKATVYKDGDDKNFTKAVEASSQNVIAQEASGGDDNSKFYTSSTTTTSSSKFSSEQRSASGDAAYEPINLKESMISTVDRSVTDNSAERNIKYGDHPTDRSSKTVIRKVYTENVPNELKNNPNYIDGKTKVTTETKTLPDGSTLTTTRYETKGATQYSTSSASSRHVSSSSNEQRTSDNLVKTHLITSEDVGRDFDDRSTRSNSICSDTAVKIDKRQSTDSKSVINRSNLSDVTTREVYHDEDIRRSRDVELIGRDAKDGKTVRNIEIIVKKGSVPERVTTTTTTVTKTINSGYEKEPKQSGTPGSNTETVIETRDIPSRENRTITSTTVAKNVDTTRPDSKTTTSTIVTKSYTVPTEENATATSTTVTKKISTNYDKQQAVSTDFLDTERIHEVQTRNSTSTAENGPKQIEPVNTHTTTETEHIIRKGTVTSDNKQIVRDDYPRESDLKPALETVEIIIPIRTPSEKNDQPERRRPIKPGKSELDQKPTPTDGQYDTTYRTDYVPKRISVDVSPTHDAFARSLRSVSPDRVSKTGSTKSLRTISSTSVRSTSSPERFPTKSNRGFSIDSTTATSPASKTSKSPEVTIKARPRSPEKKSPQRTIGKHTDTNTTVKTTPTKTTTTAKDKRTEVDSNTLTKSSRPGKKPRSRSTSPTSIASDIEFIRHDVEPTTDLDNDDVDKNITEDIRPLRRHTEEFNKRPSLGDTSSKKPQKIVDKSATLPLTDLVPQRNSSSPVKPAEKSTPKAIRRTDTYEERCKEILGISDNKEVPRKQTQPESTPITDSKNLLPNERKTKPVQEFPSQIRRSPQKESSFEKTKDNKKPAQELPSQTRKSPQRKPASPEKPRYDKKPSSVQEFPSQIRKSPQKERLEPYPGKPKDIKKPSSVQEFPSQTRRSPQKELLKPYPEKSKDDKKPSSVQEFPSQIRKLSPREPLEPYPEKSKDGAKKPSSVQEFPSQIRRSPQKELLEPYPEKPKDDKRAPTVQEFPSQARKPSQREPLEPYPEKPKDDTKKPSTVHEFPSQIRKSPEKEPLEPYPEKPKDNKRAPTVQEFPSQIRKSPQKELLEPYPEKPKDDKRAPTVQEFPSQARKPLQKEPLEPYPEKVKDDAKKPSSVQEFPSQIRKTPQNELVEPYPQDEFHSPMGNQPHSTLKTPIDSKTKRITESKYIEVVDREDSDDDNTRLVSSDDDEPLRKGPNKVSLDDLPTIKTEKVSLDDIPAYTKKSAKKSPEKVRLDDLRRSDVVADSFITSERTDTDITLKKYKDESIRKIKGISSDITSRTRKSKVTSVKTDGTESTDSTTDEEDEDAEVDDTLESQIIEDINAVVERTDTTTIKEIQRRRQPRPKAPKIGDEESRDGIKPKTATPSQPQIEDFITVTKTQLLQSGSKVPIEEPMHTKKFISVLAKEEEEDRRRQKQTCRKTKVISPDNKQVQRPNKPVKKEFTPRTSDQRNQIEIVVKNQKLDVVLKPKVGSIRRPEPKLTTRRIPDEKPVGRTEYTDQYTTKTTDKRVSKPVTSKVSTKTTLTPTKQETKKTLQVRDTTLQKKGVSVTKITHIEGKPKVPSTQLKQTTKTKPADTKQPRTTTTAITRTAVQKTVEIQPVRRHVVSTIINIKPKNKPETITKTIHRTTATKTILAPKTRISKGKPRPVMNGHVSTDEDDSDIEIVEEITPRTPLKTTPKDRASPTKRSPLPKSVEATTERRKKCITTKSILIENAVADQREIIVDLKRSKSSREGTPDRICPYPVSIESDLGIARYPDRVMEPDDDGRRSKPKRISDVALDEAEDVTQFNRVREIEETGVKPTKTKVETTSDECLLSVNEKVNKFLNTAEQITRKPADDKPAPKVERPKLEVDDSLKEDECLLSVSDKVHKFITTAELLAAGTKETMHRSKSPKYKDPKAVPDDQDEIPLKSTATPVSELLESKTTVTSEHPTTFRITDETRRNIPVKLSVSPERKFPSMPTSRQEKSPARIQRGTPERKVPERDSNVHRIPEKGPKTERTPERKFSDSYLKKSTQEIVKIRRESFEDDGTPKTSRRLSKDDPNTVLSPAGRLRSTETVKKAKAIFENIGKETETTRARGILSRPSVFEGKKLKSERTDENLKIRDVRTRLTYDEVKRSPSPNKEAQTESKPRHRSPEPAEIPHYMTPLDRTVREQHQREKDVPSDEDVEEFDRSRESSPDRNVPHYMLPLDRSLRERSPHKENVKQLEDIMNRSITTTCSDETEVKTTKFGVTLKRTDSGKMTAGLRKSSTSSVDDRPRIEFEIEEIFDLEYLEKLLETIVGYDIRKRIRTQIRIIKRAIEENTLEALIVSRLGSKKRESPEKRKSVDKDDHISRTGHYSSTYETRRQTERETKEISEYQSSYRRDSLSEYTIKTKSPSPTRNRKEPSPKRKDKSRTPERRTLNTDEVDTKTITTAKTFQTDLRRVKPTTKPVSGDKPEWITQKTLRKVSDSGAPVKKTQTTTTTVQKRVTTTKGETQPTDVITSSYGVGPTDENGTPLFGLKALRAQNKSEKTKVQGTVIRSQFYSENGEEPEGQITVTKFSTDPEELGVENVTNEKGISSVTTTQKFGYKGTPSLKSISGSKNKKTSEVDVESKSSLKSSKITRRGSVKEISQKFIENAVDTLKSERQSSYPKAGLILRTSSFKDAPAKGSDSRRSKEGSPATQEVRQKIVTSVETTSTTSDNKKTNTFLTDKSTVTGVQDVISRMKNEAEIEVDETEEDAEARNLLNKFIGSQVLLAGMESHVSKSPVTALTVSPENVKRTIKITTSTSSSESSKPTIVTRTFTHPITFELLQDVWDEQTLKLLLEQSTDYEDRRIIRARLREVMAEQEACAELVEKASDEAATKESGSTVHGECLLLPLLQGLLDQPEADQPADSGTESGEDLRSGLIVEVQSALDKLTTSLKSPATNIGEERRDSLLQLVARLQAGLSTSQLNAPSTSSSSSLLASTNERRSSLHQGRFSKRKQRPNRHTVGVTAEELEDARRLMEEIALHGNIQSVSNSSALQKQNSEGSVLQTPPFKPLSKAKPVKNVTAKPFISSNVTSQTQSGTSSTVETPSETSGSLEFLLSSHERLKTSDTQTCNQKEAIEQESQPPPPPPPPAFRHSKSLDSYGSSFVNNSSNDTGSNIRRKRSPLSETVSFDHSRDSTTVDLLAIQMAVTQAAANKQLSQMKSDVSEEAVGNGNVHDTEEERDESEEEEDEEDEEEDDQATVKTAVHQEIEAETRRATVQPQPDLIMQTNPIYHRSADDREDDANNNNSDNDDYPAQLNEKANRFNSKKLKMKRANTIDIPKPLKYYECDEDDSDDEDWNRRRNSYLALRGPIRVGKSNPEKKVPEFEPKTESDRKFVAFLGKHSEQNPCEKSRPKSLWCNRQQDRSVGNYVNNWSNKFGNMKSNFEKIQATGGNNGVNSARNFWKSADDAVTAGRVSQLGPRISRQSAKNLQEMFEEKRKQSHQRQTNSNVVTGYLKLDTTGSTDKSVSVVVTQPNSFNKFSHAPMSAFKPLSKKSEISTQPSPPNKFQSISYVQSKSLNIPDFENKKEGTNETPETPLYLYSPKVSPQNVSPVHATPPWHQRKASGESRVLSIAASKFQNVQQERERPPPPRRMSKEKIAIPPGLINQQIQPRETLTAPYLVRSFARENSVRKLSGQYDGLGNRDADVPSSNNTKTRIFVPGENYTIQYDNPVISKPQPKVYNAEYTITQQHYNLPSVRSDDDYRHRESEPETRFNRQIQRAPQIYDEQPRIHNQPRQQPINDQDQHYKRQSQSYDYRDDRYETHGIRDHNQQQQMYVKMQQPPSNTDRCIDPSSARQPKVFTEPDKSVNDQQYTSNYQFKPQIQINPAQKTRENDSYVGLRQEVDREVIKKYSSEVNNLNKQHSHESKSFEYERQISQEGVQEYNPVSSKVMSGPVSQQAVTVQQNAPKSRDQHDMEYNLKATLQKFSSQSDYRKEPKISPKSSPERRTSTVNETNPPLVVYNNVKQRPSLCVNDKPLSLESLEINERGESVLTSRFHIPLRQQKSSVGGSGHELSKSESWHQICQNSQTVNKPSPRASPNSRAVTRSKSSHTLAVPKQFEAGMTKSEMVEKKKTMEAYFGSAQNVMQKGETKKANSSSINRVKTSQKVSTQRQNSNSGLCRSKTLPDIVCLDKLDDSNIDAIFEDLFNAKSTTRTTTFTEGPVTTTSQVTTRVTAQEPVKKPMSPFAKFRQLDKQNSLNSPPSTPKSPTSGGPLFKFTDPSLNQSANTVKQRLLQWCQMKTKEYENIQLDNFSTSWADGMAFCALIHHFLPDAFDFYALSPRNRRHNFTLAFRVADEKAGIAPLLDVDDMVAISRPDWKCVFTYVQSIYRRFKDED